MSKTAFESLLAYQSRLIDIMNNDEIWDGGRCTQVFGAAKTDTALEEIIDGDFSDERKEAAKEIQEMMNQIGGLMEDISCRIDDLTAEEQDDSEGVEAEAA